MPTLRRRAPGRATAGGLPLPLPLPLLLPLLLLLLLVLLSGAASGSEIEVSIKIPIAVAENSSVNMTCDYDLHSMPLYAVKWYKGLNEFYRYIPKEHPAKSSFGALGEKVDLNKSDQHSVIVSKVGSELAGKYRCEVSTDQPYFLTKLDAAYMNVVKLPEGNVTARLEKPRYALGDTVRGNCSVPLGNPPANITWTVNRLPINSSYTRNITIKLGNETRSMTLAGIEFDVSPESFQNGRILVSCRAEVFHLYQRQANVRLEEERPRLASVLGTRESSYNNSTSGLAQGLCSALLLLLLLADALLR